VKLRQQRELVIDDLGRIGQIRLHVEVEIPTPARIVDPGAEQPDAGGRPEVAGGSLFDEPDLGGRKAHSIRAGERA